MQNTKIIRLLKCFSAKEMREFRKFVSSPFHNNRRILVGFYDILKEYYPDFESVSGKEVYGKLYPGTKYDSAELVRLSSYLFKLARDFLAVSEFNESTFYYDDLLLMSLDNHNADSLFEKEYEHVEKKLNSEKIHNQFFISKGQLEVDLIDFKLRRNKQNEICSNIVRDAEYDIFNLIIKLVLRYCDMLSNKFDYNYDFSNTTAELFISNFNFDEFIRCLRMDEPNYYNFVLCFYYQFKALTEPTNEYYYKMLREYSFRDFEKLSELEMGNRYIRLFRYCITQLRRGNLKFLQDCFEFHKEALEKQLYGGNLSGGRIYPVFFRNFVVYGIAAKEYDYIERFIGEYGAKLKEEYRKDMVSVSSALLQFEKKRYDKALESLSSVRYTYPSCQMDMKGIYIKIFYETDDYESLFTLIDSFKHYLKRDKTIWDVIRMQNLSFLNYTNKLAKLKLKINDELYPVQNSIKENMKMDPIQKMWLIEKTEELSTLWELRNRGAITFPRYNNS